MLYRCIYASQLAASIDSAALDAVLAEIELTSSRYNGAQKLTGMLLSIDRYFMQILEGSNRQISELIAKLFNDSRHDNMIILEFIAVDHRVFPEWTMKVAPVKRRTDVSQSVWNPDKLTAQAILKLGKTIRAGLLDRKRGVVGGEATPVVIL